MNCNYNKVKHQKYNVNQLHHKICTKLEQNSQLVKREKDGKMLFSKQNSSTFVKTTLLLFSRSMNNFCYFYFHENRFIQYIDYMSKDSFSSSSFVQVL